MKILIKNVKNISIIGEYIRLDSLLKFCSLASTGGEAKTYIQNGDVFVNGNVCTQRGKKIKNGDFVRYNNQIFRVIGKMSSFGNSNADK